MPPYTHGPYIAACAAAITAAGVPLADPVLGRDPTDGEQYAILTPDPDWVSQHFGGLHGCDDDAGYGLLWGEGIGWNVGIHDENYGHESHIRPKIPLTRFLLHGAPTPAEVAADAHHLLTQARGSQSSKLRIYDDTPAGLRELAAVLATYTST
ncbi:hypothetical protein ACH4E8_29375 [Streptomyces sp. NPDC017979]|uniref:hypothetical protein n=1 Tax=Streptomyces sp. NPDC017979 TaxID=3365024 RepID=UPI003794A380